jgi:N-acetylglucosamine kinase-like BadF-type ATPase
MDLFLGLDGGGSRTQAYLGDGRNHILARAEAGPSNPLKVGIEEAKRELLRAARAALRGVAVPHARQTGVSAQKHRPGQSVLAGVCAGVAGVSRQAIGRPLLAWLREAIPARHHLLVTDAEIALFAAVGTGAGMIVVAGTGSIAFARDCRGRTLRAGGWGASFDDLGSGYDLGRKAIMAALEEYDGRSGRTLLTRRICRALKLSEITQVVLKDLTPQQVAALSPLVSEAARDGDRVARRLCAEAAHDLARLALALARRVGRGAGPVVCAGGVLSSPAIRRSFARHVHRCAPSLPVRLLRREPAEGALDMARRLAMQ